MTRKALLVLLALALISGYAFAQGEVHAYQGLKKCVMCHKGPAKGNIFETWQGTEHAKAFEVLATPAAKAAWDKLEKKQGAGPQEDPACLTCHVTGFGEADNLTASLTKEDGITCESCHGAGADYGKMTVMKDRDAAIAAGMTPNPKAQCITCHNEKSPTFKGFKFEEMWPKIQHAIPEK